MKLIILIIFIFILNSCIIKESYDSKVNEFLKGKWEVVGTTSHLSFTLDKYNLNNTLIDRYEVIDPKTIRYEWIFNNYKKDHVWKIKLFPSLDTLEVYPNFKNGFKTCEFYNNNTLVLIIIEDLK